MTYFCYSLQVWQCYVKKKKVKHYHTFLQLWKFTSFMKINLCLTINKCNLKKNFAWNLHQNMNKKLFKLLVVANLVVKLKTFYTSLWIVGINHDEVFFIIESFILSPNVILCYYYFFCRCLFFFFARKQSILYSFVLNLVNVSYGALARDSKILHHQSNS